MREAQKKKQKLRVCPSCGKSRYESVCPECAVALRGWQYAKALAATRMVYGRPYATYTKATGRRQQQTAVNGIIIANIFLLPFGITWLTALYKHMPSLARILLGIYALAAGGTMLYVQSWGANPLNIAVTVLLYLIPGITATARGLGEYRSQGADQSAKSTEQ